LSLLLRFIGLGEGPEDLSVRYKEYLGEPTENRISLSAAALTSTQPGSPS
jgi:hypothetical protein